jgi:soluble P-type ATPase
MLKWRGIQATTELAKSPNSKIIIMGTGQNNLPLLLNADTPLATESAPERR